jgi:hypothetical protein
MGNSASWQAMEFAQSKGNARRDGSTGVTFAEVGGLGNTIQEMQEVVEVRCAGSCCAVLCCATTCCARNSTKEM